MSRVKVKREGERGEPGGTAVGGGSGAATCRCVPSNLAPNRHCERVQLAKQSRRVWSAISGVGVASLPLCGSSQ